MNRILTIVTSCLNRLKIDYDQLPDELTELSSDELKKATDKLNQKLTDLHNHLVKIQAPNMKVGSTMILNYLE